MAKQSKLRTSQLRRIKGIIERAEKKGYTFGNFKEAYKTYSTQKLKNLTPAQVKSEADYIPNFTDIVLKQIEEMIAEGIRLNIRTGREENCTTAENASYLDRLLQAVIAEYGRDKVALACEQAPDETIVRAHETIWASTTAKCVRHGMDTILLIRGNIPTIEEAKVDEESIELTEDLSDYEIP